MYKVLKRFKDKDEHIYEIGDVYPAEGKKKPIAARVKVLSTQNNAYKTVFIVEDKKEV